MSVNEVCNDTMMHARAINQLKSNDWSRATPNLLHKLLLVAMIGNALVDGIKYVHGGAVC